jgi:hypothetical protein
MSPAGGSKFDFMGFARNRQLQPIQRFFLAVIPRRLAQLRRHSCPGDVTAATARRSHAVAPIIELICHVPQPSMIRGRSRSIRVFDLESSSAIVRLQYWVVEVLTLWTIVDIHGAFSARGDQQETERVRSPLPW